VTVNRTLKEGDWNLPGGLPGPKPGKKGNSESPKPKGDYRGAQKAQISFPGPKVPHQNGSPQKEQRTPANRPEATIKGGRALHGETSKPRDQRPKGIPKKKPLRGAPKGGKFWWGKKPGDYQKPRKGAAHNLWRPLVGGEKSSPH